MLSVQPDLRGSNDFRVGRKMATFQLFLQSCRGKDISAPLHTQQPGAQSTQWLGCVLDYRGIDSRQGQWFNFSQEASRRSVGPQQSPVRLVPGVISTEMKWLGRKADYLRLALRLRMNTAVETSWNVMAHGQKPNFVFQRNERLNLNLRGRQFSRLMAAEVCASAVVMLDTPCSEVVWRVLATHSIRQFPLHFPSLRHRVPSHCNWSLPQLRLVRSCHA